METRSKFEGSLFGLAAGDAIGAPYEGGPLERLVWRAIGKTREGKRRWTDDTQMTLDLASSLVEKEIVDQDDIAARFAASYRWSRGYGPGAAKVLKRIRRGMTWQRASRSVFADGSHGNGAAMRSSVVGLRFYNSPDRIDDAAHKCAEITHAHPLAIDGARLIAHATAEACVTARASEVWNRLQVIDCSVSYRSKLNLAFDWADSKREIPFPEIRKQLGNGMAAADSVITSIFIGLTNAENEFDKLLEMAIKLGGDTDTIAAMAGSIWGALRGIEQLTRESQDELENDVLIRKTARDLLEATLDQTGPR